MNTKEKFYITTAIAYASRKPHFGNTYEVIMTDAIARYKRARGFDVFFCTGTDEHGQKIEDLANGAGITPKAYVDGVAGEIRGIWDKMNTSYDYFIRTTDDYHEATVKKIFKKFYYKGDIYKGKYEGWYCTPCESFFTETQAAEGKCPDCGRPVQKASEEAYFFKMSNYSDRLMEYIDAHPEFIEPESRKKEMVNNFLKSGLQDLCVSRTSFKWGIPVDFDDRHVVYVWLDALTNYITALGYDADKTYEEQSEHFKKYWPCDVHIIGKDILRFHTLYWPIFLMALDIPLPKKVFGHPWFNFGVEKMSKSRGNVVNPDELVEKYGADSLRLYEMFMGPLEASLPWSNTGVEGAARFVDRVFRVFTDPMYVAKHTNVNDGKLDFVYNQTVKKVTSDFENLQFNTAISQMMIFINEVYKVENIYRPYLVEFVKMFSCICPFVGEEIWNLLGNEDLITYAKWPTHDESKLVLTKKQIGVQVLGKLRGTIEIDIDEAEETVKEKAFALESVQKHMEGKQVVKVIYVKNKIVNIVVK